MMRLRSSSPGSTGTAFRPTSTAVIALVPSSSGAIEVAPRGAVKQGLRMSELPEDRSLSRLLENNRKWAARMLQVRPDFFRKLAQQQSPEVLWIGCSDSRVPANEIIDVLPGEVFVHRNVANQVLHVDFNCLAVLQYAVETLGVRHIIVCGHYGCGGVIAALHRQQTSLIGNWLYALSELGTRHRAVIDAVPVEQRVDVLCEINVIEQEGHGCQTTILDRAWRR